ncbi:hypothetical protein ACFYKX_04720 [Cytobacillus sp. FJAT-54145]|uniref:DUF4367 domain-containing protein n=1 Tax=Cytobacillus spartinae TaxID=3299023 RepID=A0ABW6KAV6_9BACI
MKISKMKGTAVVLIFILMLVGWSTFRGKMYDIDHSEVSQVLETFSHDIKSPTKVPFKDLQLWEYKKESDNQTVITLMNVNKSTLDIRVSKDKIDFNKNIKKEHVTLNGDLEGVYFPDSSGKRILVWQDHSIYYEITYYPKLTLQEVSKQQLIRMAESFRLEK